MTLFDKYNRTDLKTAGYSDNIFTYINQSALERYNELRILLEEWYDKYKLDIASHLDLRNRFRNKRDFTHMGAFLELYYFQLLIGHKFILSKEITKQGQTPDFYETQNDFYIEVTNAWENSKTHDALINQITDKIDSIRTNEFFISLGPIRIKQKSIKLNRIQRWVINILDNLVYIEEFNKFKNSGYGGLTQYTYEDESISMTLSFMPKNSIDKINEGAIGIKYYGMYKDNTYEVIFKTLEKKSSKYSSLNSKYIIALNTAYNIRIKPAKNEFIELLKGWFFRKENHHISGIIFTHRLEAEMTRITNINPILIHNPYCTKKININIWNIPQICISINDNSYQEIPGMQIHEILKLNKEYYIKNYEY